MKLNHEVSIYTDEKDPFCIFSGPVRELLFWTHTFIYFYIDICFAMFIIYNHL